MAISDFVALKGDKEIADKINKANGLKGVIDVADFNDARAFERRF